MSGDVQGVRRAMRELRNAVPMSDQARRALARVAEETGLSEQQLLEAALRSYLVRRYEGRETKLRTRCRVRGCSNARQAGSSFCWTCEVMGVAS